MCFGFISLDRKQTNTFFSFRFFLFSPKTVCRFHINKYLILLLLFATETKTKQKKHTHTGQPRAIERVALLADGPRGALHVGRQQVRQQRPPQALPLGLRELLLLRAHVHPRSVLPRVLLAYPRPRVELETAFEVRAGGTETEPSPSTSV